MTEAQIKIEVPQDRIADFCRRWKIVELALFGSVLTDGFGPHSDVGILVRCAEDATWSLFDLVTMQEGLKQLFGQEVDLVERQAVENSENYIRRRHILSSVETVYVAR
jgi:predicted nucleotidyltransferase